MRKVILYVILTSISFICAAQNTRVVKGTVYGDSSTAIAGATVYAVGADVYAKTDNNGSFAITIPGSVTELQVEARAYHTLTLQISGEFMVFNMTLDETYASRAYQYASAELDAAKKAMSRDALKAKEKAEKLARRRQLDSLYNLKYKNSGLVHSFEISYGYQLAHEKVAYKNLGFREYGSLNPIEFRYTLSYKFNYFFSAGIGTGIQYQLVNLLDYPDVIDPGYIGHEDFTPVNVPVFLNIKAYLTRGKLQPIVSVSGGIYCPNMEGMIDAGIGLNFRISRLSNAYLLFSMRSTPYGDFRQYASSGGGMNRDFSVYYTSVAWTPSVKLGYTF